MCKTRREKGTATHRYNSFKRYGISSAPTTRLCIITRTEEINTWHGHKYFMFWPGEALGTASFVYCREDWSERLA